MNSIRLILGLAIAEIMVSCGTLKLDISKPGSSLDGENFYEEVSSLGWEARDSIAQTEILAGNIPKFFQRFTPIEVSIYDSIRNMKISAKYFVSLDYLSIGNDKNWARIPLTPMTAQTIADSFHCFLPTTKIVEDINKSANVKLKPMPMFAFRDSSVTMYHHHLIIEGQRMGRKGLITGIKKDVVITDQLKQSKSDRVAIYGWHKLNGEPIQPLYTGHVNWYVDYSHGIRLVYRKIKVNGKWLDYKEVLNSPSLRRLVSYENDCEFIRYETKN